MAKKSDPSVLDGLLDVIATATEYYLCVGEPADRAAAISSSVIPAIMMGGGDYTKGTGAGNSREQTVAAKSAVANAGGTPDHVALCTGALLLYVSTVSNPQLVTIGNDVNLGSWKTTVNQPT